MMKIGFIGLGHMGLPMALNLCRKGFEVFVCSSKKESQETVIKAGGQFINGIQKMAEICDVIISIVPADKEILNIYTSEDGVVNAAKAGLICIDMTSAMGVTKKQILSYIDRSEKELYFLDAPVSGGVAGAQAGTLTIMVGGEKRIYEKCLAIFEAMGTKIVYTGEVGSASDVKMINQMLNAVNTAAAAEALYMARTLGIEDSVLLQIINESSGGSYVFEKNVPKYMMSGDHTPGFRLKLMKKDLNLYLETAKKLDIFTMLPELAYQIYQAVYNQGNGDKNYTYIYEWLKGNQEQRD